MAQKTAVHFGGGNIGRGFVACFLHESGYDVIFVDVVDSLIEKINATPSYKVIEVGTEGTSEKTITNYKAISSKTHEADVVSAIAKADVLTCSVGPTILKFLAGPIAKGLAARATSEPPLAVIACENMIGGTDALAGFIAEREEVKALSDYPTRVAYANSAIDRIVPTQDPNSGLDVTLEKFYEWVVEQKPFKSRGVPEIKGIHWVDDLKPFIERKLYTVNTGHATAAYWGYSKGYKTVSDAMEDKDILAQVQQALAETSDLIITKHGLAEAEQKEYVAKIITRFSNPHLKDDNTRVARAPCRKLGRHERFVGPGSQLAEAGKPIPALLAAVGEAFKFQNVEGDDESKELAKIVADNSAEEIVTKVCGVTSSDKIYSQLVEVVNKIKA